MNPDDSVLIARVRETDDPAAFGELVRRHQSTVRLFLRQLTHGDSDLADDLAQETFILAYRRVRGFREEARFTTWLLGIAHNLARNHRRKRREAALEPGHLGMLEATPSSVVGSDMRADVAQALEALSADERTLLHMNYQLGLAHSDIASVLGWPLGTVKTQIARSKDKLRTLLSPWNRTA